MKRVLRLAANWRLAADVLRHPGDYRVPQDMDEAMAERAVRDGLAFWLDAIGDDDPTAAAAPAAPGLTHQRKPRKHSP